MQTAPYSALPPSPRVHQRAAFVVSADRCFGQRLSDILTGLRWQVRIADSDSQAWGEAEMSLPEAVITDTWLPDLDIAEFLTDFRGRFPLVDLISASGAAAEESQRGPHRQELLYAVHRTWIRRRGMESLDSSPGKRPMQSRIPEAGYRPPKSCLRALGESWSKYLGYPFGRVPAEVRWLCAKRPAEVNVRSNPCHN